MLLKAAPGHPLFDYLTAKGPEKFTDMKLVGGSFHFICHSLLALPISMIPSPFPTTAEKLIVILPPEVKEEEALHYLTYIYSGRLPSKPEEFRGFMSLVKILWSNHVIDLAQGGERERTPKDGLPQSDKIQEVLSDSQVDINFNIDDTSDAINC
eukprot:GFUD01024180.1.p1 GENE.GFUD01024180.1~~GFUD01024180.1.p1  ORF type:complete len:169 (+),score=25.62 GFUD01024180.1:46-507(+)